MIDKLTNWLRRFMYGRYGVDQLSITLIVVAFIVSIFSPRLRIPALISMVIFVAAYFRVFSRNINKRYMENQKFLKAVSPISKMFRSLKMRIEGRKDFKYFKCKNCGQQIKVPKGKGKIRITCPKCGDKTVKNT